MMIICLHAVLNKLEMMYFTDRTCVVLTDDSHFINASITDWLVVALSDSDELSFLRTQDTLLFCHLVEMLFNQKVD